ncbi:MAG: DUF2958 domain-containing protein [Dehalococcoidia bacterium]
MRRLELVTKEIAKRLPALYANEALSAEEVKVPLKIFDPCGRHAWYATEYDPEGKLAFGYVVGGFGPDCDELGYFSITEIENVKGPLGIGMERDLCWDPETTLADVIEGKVR